MARMDLLAICKPVELILSEVLCEPGERTRHITSWMPDRTSMRSNSGTERKNSSTSQGDDKKRARLNCIAHLLSLLPHAEVERAPIKLPTRVRNPDYSRRPLPESMFVPQRY
jgi:hypothetical protein